MRQVTYNRFCISSIPLHDLIEVHDQPLLQILKCLYVDW